MSKLVSVCICVSSTGSLVSFIAKTVFLVKMIYILSFFVVFAKVFLVEMTDFFCVLHQCILMMEASTLSMCRHTNEVGIPIQCV